MEPYFIYVWVRTDIPLAQQLVQVGHACYDAGVVQGHLVTLDTSEDTLPESPHMCLLQVPSQDALKEVATHLMSSDIQFQAFFEPDNDMGFSAICTEPIKGDKRKALRGYKLWE